MGWKQEPAANDPREPHDACMPHAGALAFLPGRPPGTARDSAPQEEKLRALGLLATGIAHDFNNLLAVVVGNAALLGEMIPPGHPQREILDGVISGSEQAAELARRLLTYARTPLPDRCTLDLNVAARDTCAMLGRILGDAVSLELNLEPGVHRVAADATQISQVLVNLIMNARDALPDGAGRIWVRTRNGSAGVPGLERGHVVLEVEDDGVGMDADTRARVLEPFFSTKPNGSGTGLGLAIVEAIVRRHGGQLAIESEPGRGTRVRVQFPAGVDAGQA